jgi:hypothetical protein
LQTGTLQILWGIGIVLLFLGVILDLSTGNSGYSILSVNGTSLIIWWVALRGIALGAQRFVAAQTKIVLSLFVTTVGSVVISLAIAMSVLVGNTPSNTTFLLSGAFVFFLGIAMYVLSLALTKPSAESAPKKFVFLSDKLRNAAVGP